jgi:hypothetical protein
VTQASFYLETRNIYNSASLVPTSIQTLIHAAALPTQLLISPFDWNMDLSIIAMTTNSNIEELSRVQLNMKVDVTTSIYLNLSLAHLTSLLSLLESIDRFIRCSIYRRFRPASLPSLTTSGDCSWRQWWKYAISAVLKDLNDPVRQRPTWKNTLNLMLFGLQYTALRRVLAPHLTRRPVHR